MIEKDEKTKLYRSVRWLIYIVIIAIVAPLLFTCAAYIIGSSSL